MADNQETTQPAGTEAQDFDTVADAVLDKYGIRDTTAPPVKDRNKSAETVAQPVPPAGQVPPLGPPAKPGERARDATGRFVKQDSLASLPAEQPAAVVAAAAGTAQNAPDASGAAIAPAEAATPVPPEQKAPGGWKAAGEHWAILPQPVRDEILLREQQFHSGLELYKEAANFGSTVAKIVTQPQVATMLQHYRVPAEQMLGELVAAQVTLSYGSQEKRDTLIANLIRTFGGNPENIAKVLGGQPLEDPRTLEAERQAGYWRQQNEQMITQHNERIHSDARSELARLEADTVNFPHIKEPAVRQEMHRLIMGSPDPQNPISYQDAYNRAIWYVPETRAKLQAQQQEQARKEAAEKAEAARRAAAVVVPRGGKPAPNTTGTESVDKLMDGVLAKHGYGVQ